MHLENEFWHFRVHSKQEYMLRVNLGINVGNIDKGQTELMREVISLTLRGINFPRDAQLQ
jgi:hypothetical protein